MKRSPDRVETQPQLGERKRNKAPAGYIKKKTGNQNQGASSKEQGAQMRLGRAGHRLSHLGRQRVVLLEMVHQALVRLGLAVGLGSGLGLGLGLGLG